MKAWKQLPESSKTGSTYTAFFKLTGMSSDTIGTEREQWNVVKNSMSSVYRV